MHFCLSHAALREEVFHQGLGLRRVVVAGLGGTVRMGRQSGDGAPGSRNTHRMEHIQWTHVVLRTNDLSSVKPHCWNYLA